MAVTAVGLVLRVLFVLLEPATAPTGDEQAWLGWGVDNLLSEKVRLSPFRNHLVFHPPGYPYFLAVSFLATGSLLGVKLVQALLSALLIPAVALVAGRAFSPRAALPAAALAALYPELVWFAAHYWSETLFLVLLWWGFERLLAAGEGTWRTAAAAGALWGLAILTRETALYFVPLAGSWLLRGTDGRGGPRAAAFVLTAAAVVAPWTARNWIVFGAFVPVSTAGGLNLYQGNAPLSRHEVYDLYYAVPGGRIGQYRWARRMGLRAIADRQPWWLSEKLAQEMPNFWEADSLALVHVRRGAYGPDVPAWAAGGATLLLAGSFLAVLAAFLAALFRVPLGRGAALLLGFLAYYTLLHVATHGFARYRLPVMPVLFCTAAGGWALAAARVGPLRRVLAAAVALVLATSVVPSARELPERLAGGRSGVGEGEAGEAEGVRPSR